MTSFLRISAILSVCAVVVEDGSRLVVCVGGGEKEWLW